MGLALSVAAAGIPLTCPLACLLACLLACSDSSTSGTSPVAGPDASTTADGAPVVVGAATESKQVGQIIRAQTTEGVAGATVTVAGNSATTNGNGEYELLVPRGTPYQMTVTADGFYKLLEQEWLVEKDSLARGVTNLLLTQTANLLANFLPDRTPAKGIVVVKIELVAPCESEEGSTLTLEPAGASKLSYFSGQIPDPQQASVHKGSTFSGVFYNVDVGVPLKVNVTSPGCKAVPFPFAFDGVTYTGNTKAEADEAFSYHRVFLTSTASTTLDAGRD